jgi:hypothetical protein
VDHRRAGHAWHPGQPLRGGPSARRPWHQGTNDEGDTAAYSNIHGNGALLCYSNPNPGLLAPSAGYVFQWTGVSEGLGTEIGVSRFRQPQLKAERIEGQIAWTNKKVAADLGHYFATICSATG